MVIITTPAANAAAIITTPATANVSSDSQGSGTSVALPNILITEGAAADIATGNHIWTVPTGYVFDETSVPSVAYTGTTLAGAATATMASTTMSINITAASTVAGTMRIGSSTPIKVRVSTGCPMASAGNINMTTGAIASLTGSSNFGTLTQVAGAATKLLIALPGQTFSASACNVPSGTVTEQTVSQSFNLDSITAADQFFNKATSYSGAKTLTYTTTNNVSGSFTTAVTFTAGVSTGNVVTTLLQPVNVNTQLTLADGSISGPISSVVRVKDVAGGGVVISSAPLAPAPSAPTGLKVTGVTDNSVSLSWDAVAGAAGYNVYSNNYPTGTFFLLTASQPSTSALAFTDKNLMRGVTYYYVVTALNSQGWASSYSSQVSATPVLASSPATPAVPTVTPAIPATPTTPAAPAAPAVSGLPYTTPVGATQIGANITYLQQQLLVLLQQLLALLLAGR